MKLWFASLTAAIALNNAGAQLLSPEAAHFGLLGALIGGAAGGGHHRGWSGDGAAIGAGVGLVTGALIGESRRQQYYNSAYAYPPPAYAYHYSYGPAYSYYPPGRPDYAVGGTLLGAASGALIGEGTSGKPGEGAAIGAAAGLVLGSVAEHNARQRGAAPVAVRQSMPNSSAGRLPSPSPWQPVTAPRHQIPDAPRVPDAPTF